MKPGILIAIIAVLVVGIIVVVVVTSSGEPKTPGTIPANQKSEPLTDVEISENMGGVSGTITGINKNILSVDAFVLLKDATKPPVKHTVKVLVSENTKLTKTILPTAEEIMAANGAVQPKQSEIKLSDLKVGDKIEVAAETFINENIKNGEPINAVSLNVSVAGK